MRGGAIVSGIALALAAAVPAAAVADGELDAGFGAGGSVTTSFVENGGAEGPAWVAILDDGRIVSAGMGGGNGVGISRYLPSGGPDPSFDEDGRFFVQPNPGGFDAVMDAALTGDGGVVTVGFGEVGMGPQNTEAVRVTADGKLDPGFGEDPPNPVDDGIVTYDIGVAGNDFATAVDVDPAGRIYIAGKAGTGSANDVYLGRLTRDGALDTSLAGTGYVLTNPGTNDRGLDVLWQPDGRLLVAAALDGQLAVLRYREDGSLDPSFGGGDGIAPTGLVSPEAEVSRLAVQPDGRILLAGSVGSFPNFRFAVARLNSDGSLDSTFAGDGNLALEIGTNDFLGDVAIADDGRIVLVGAVRLGSDDQAAAVRLLPDGGPDLDFGSGGVVLLGAAGTSERGSAVAIQPDRKIVVGADFSDGTSGDRVLFRILGDTRPPDTKLTRKPKRRVATGRRVRFEFKEVGDVNASFECRLKVPGKRAKGFKPCESPVKKRARRGGRYSFRARAVDPAGNVDPKPAKARFRAAAA